MATKDNDPCREKAKDDEPLFTLLARDITAPILVDLWAELRRLRDGSTEQVMDALRLASNMRQWKWEQEQKEKQHE